MSSEVEHPSERAGRRRYERRHRRYERPRRRPSLFWPIVLIAVGGYFLLVNAGLTPSMSWRVLLQFWPVIFIFAGLDILFQNATGVIGLSLSLLLALALIAGFGYLMLNYENYPQLFDVEGSDSPTRQHEAYPIAGVESATLVLDAGVEPVALYSLQEGEGDLVVVDALTPADLQLANRGSARYPELTLDADAWTGRQWWVWLNPAQWGRWASGADETYWRVGVSPDVLVHLELEGGSGPLEAHLDGLSALSGLTLDVGSGSVDLYLPEAGRYEVEVEGGSGPLTIVLPPDLEARVEVVNDGSGSLSLASLFQQVEWSHGDEGVWETPSFAGAENAVQIILDVDSGAVTIEYAMD